MNAHAAIEAPATPLQPSQRYDVELVAVSKVYQGAPAVDRISLRIPKASYCCLLGPSGCGKSTTLRMIAGHEQATSGDILIGDRNVTDAQPAERGTSMMFQNYALFPHMSVAENVAFPLSVRRVARAEIAGRLALHLPPPPGRENAPFLQFRLILVSGHGSAMRRDVAYVSPAFGHAGQALA